MSNTTDNMLSAGKNQKELPVGNETGKLALIDHDEFMKNLNKASRKLVKEGEK